jgi:hypothetical protein
MSFLKTRLVGQTDATGATAINIGPVSASRYFLGFVIIQSKSGVQASYSLQDLSGAPLGGFSGSLAVLGPAYLQPSEQLILVVADGPPNTVLSGYILGDVNVDPDALIPPPQPSSIATQNLRLKNNLINISLGGSATSHLIAGVANQVITLYWLAVELQSTSQTAVNWLSSVTAAGIADFASVGASYVPAPPVSWPFGFTLPLGEGVDMVNTTGNAVNINGAIVYTQA